MGGAVAADQVQAGARLGLVERGRDVVGDAGQVPGEVAPVLRPWVRVGRPARFDRGIARIDDVPSGQSRACGQALHDAPSAELGRRSFHAREMAAERGRRADEDDPWHPQMIDREGPTTRSSTGS